MAKYEFFYNYRDQLPEVELVTGKLQDDLILEQIYNFWKKQDPESIEMRYGCSRVPVMSEYQKMIDGLVAMALIKNERGDILGFAEACRVGDTGTVEIAVAVDVEYRRRGMAVKLVSELLLECVNCGVKKVLAYVSPNNLRMMNLVNKIKSQIPINTLYRDGYIEIELDLV